MDFKDIVDYTGCFNKRLWDKSDFKKKKKKETEVESGKFQKLQVYVAIMKFRYNCELFILELARANLSLILLILQISFQIWWSKHICLFSIQSKAQFSWLFRHVPTGFS